MTITKLWIFQIYNNEYGLSDIELEPFYGFIRTYDILNTRYRRIFTSKQFVEILNNTFDIMRIKNNVIYHYAYYVNVLN